EASVAVGVLQQRDDTLAGSRLRRPFQRAGIPPILHDVHATALVERDRHRVLDQGLRGCQLDPVTRLELETGQSIVRRQRSGRLLTLTIRTLRLMLNRGE